MQEIKRETVIMREPNTTDNNVVIKNPVVTTPIRSGATNSQTREYLVYYFFGALETLLVFRLILKIAGASINSWFVTIVYTLSRFFIMPFEGIFRRATTQGVGTTSVFEPSTIVALIVYAILAYGIVKLIRISSGEEQVGGE
jgi:glucan phosphoethanolaminetransferase (alkaline phosphatase superfamily)